MKNDKVVSHCLKRIRDYYEYVSYQNKVSGTDGDHNLILADLESLDKDFHLSKDDNILDIGCKGNALTIKKLHSLGYTNVYGTEIGAIAEQMWDSLEEQVRKNLKRSDCQQGIPFDIKFKLITCSHVLEHLYEPVSALTYMKQALAEDGLLHLQVPITSLKNFIGCQTHLAFWNSAKALISFLASNGLETIWHQTRGYSGSMQPSLATRPPIPERNLIDGIDPGQNDLGLFCRVTRKEADAKK